MIDADRFVLADGTEVVGSIVNRTDEHIWVKRAEGTVPISKRLITGASTLVRVPASRTKLPSIFSLWKTALFR